MQKCFSEEVGFTDACNDCWTDNVMCDQVHCKYTCLWAIGTGQRNNREDGALNPCLACDERMCGTNVTLCAGANRRRAGIKTDIARNQAIELCGHISSDTE